MKKAFTLAEILITLGIIGVVSALTIPTLVKRNTNETHVQQLKKVYATLMQAAETAMAENNVNDLSETVLGIQGNMSAAQSKAAVKNFFNTYFKVSVDCDSTPVPCFADSYKYLDGSNYNFSYHNFTFGDCVSLADGSAICMNPGMGTRLAWWGDSTIDMHPWTQVFIDVNGSKGPNIIGRDFFEVSLYSDGKIAESYVLSAQKMQDDFDNKCNGGGGYGGCFSKIVLDGWKMDY